MELGLSLGEAPKPLFFINKSTKNHKALDFCMGLNVGLQPRAQEDQTEDQQRDSRRTYLDTLRVQGQVQDHKHDHQQPQNREEGDNPSSEYLPLQLDLLPLAPPHHRLPWSTENERNSDASSSGPLANSRGFDVNRPPSVNDADDTVAVDSPNSIASSFQMEFSIYSGSKRSHENALAGGSGGGSNDGETERASSRASDDDESGLARKKLRLSKEQSAFLEESFKEHNTLNPKQKLALAKQLNLRPRQVEVWFQNRRARTKLKQTEVDCEYLKRCCEKLTEENRRLQKELQELRALKSSHPFYMQVPATTLTMCPSCERVASTAASTTSSVDAPTKAAGFPATLKPRFHSFPRSHVQPHHSTAS